MLKRIPKFSSLFLVFALLAGCSSKSDLTTVTLNEVAHSIFYAPQYAAIEMGYFEEEGINLELVTGFGADKTMSALISDEADIGFMGSEASIYTHIQGNSDTIVNFAQLTQRAGNFVVSREPIENFTWDMLKNTTVLGGRKGGMPEMVFEYILKKNNIAPAADLTINQNIDFGATASAFSSGQGDFSIEFEPSATLLENQGAGYVVASLGTASGYVPYTAYSAKHSFLETNPELIQSFTDALQKGLDYVNSHSAKEIAETIQPQFKDTDLDTITAIVDRYKSQNTWKDNLVFEEESFILLQNILMEAGELENYIDYETLINTEFSQKAK